MTVFVVMLALVTVTALAVLATRCLRNDGWCRPEKPGRYEDEWSPDWPSHPYTDRPYR